MEVVNPFQLYSLKVKHFILFVLFVQVLLLASIGLDLIGLQVPLARQIIGVIFLLLIPGNVIFRLLKPEKLDNIESLLYTVGLSIAFLMFTGFIINQLYPIIGIKKPVSIIPLLATIYLIVSILSVICYYKTKTYYSYTFISTKELFSPITLFLFLIPLLAIYSTYFVNTYHNNTLTIIFIALISVIVLLYGFFNIIPESLYPFAIFSISLSLLFHNILISDYLWGCDIQSEYFLSNTVINNSHWSPLIGENINSMLSIVMFAPIITNVCDINLIWVFKILFPLLFSLLPVGLYKIYKEITSEKIAFVSCLFFVSGFMFYTEMLAVARQQLSELFFVLLILVTLNKSIKRIKRVFLSVLFAFSISISHYGFTYIFLLFILLSFLIHKFILFIETNNLDFKLYSKYNLNQMSRDQICPEKIAKVNLFNVNFIILIFVFTLAWYIYTSFSSPFNTFANIVISILDMVLNEFSETIGNTQGVEIITASTISSMREVTKYLHLISIFFISLGVLKLAIGRRKLNFNSTYASFSYSYYIICFMGIVIPLFASQLNTSRLYQISLLILAPFFSIGGISLFNVLTHRKTNILWTDISIKQAMKLLSVFLSVYFLFNSGLVYEIGNEESSSVSLNSTHYIFIYDEADIYAATWITSNGNVAKTILADIGGANLLRGFSHNFGSLPFSTEGVYIPEDNYTLITAFNTKFNQICVGLRLSSFEYTDIKHLTEYNRMHYIYDNGHDKINFV